MFPRYNLQIPTQAQVDIALAAHGGTVIEISKNGRDGWEVVEDPLTAGALPAIQI